MATLITTQAVFQGGSGLPEDRFINTWHFSHDSDLLSRDEIANRAANMLEIFYLETAGAGALAPNQSVARWLSGEITDVTFRTYFFGDPTPRTAEVRDNVTALPARGAGIPEEVAVCLSLHTALRSQRGRGRLYIGPLGASGAAPAFVTQANRVRVNPLLRNTIVDAALRVIDAQAANDLRWVVRSTFGPVNTVVGGYVDDAFDTQRRRGTAPTVRTAFGSVQGVS